MPTDPGPLVPADAPDPAAPGAFAPPAPVAVAAQAATSTLTFVEPFDPGEIVTIGAISYEHVLVPTLPTQWEGLGDIGFQKQYLTEAINGQNPGGTPHPQVIATEGPANTVILTAKVPGISGNAISVSTTNAAMTISSGSTLAGGADPIPKNPGSLA